MHKALAIVLGGTLMSIGQTAQAQSWGVYIGNGGAMANLVNIGVVTIGSFARSVLGSEPMRWKTGFVMKKTKAK
ncbi:MAG: hypothetical protein AB7E05_12240 [Sphingobium sp.]